MGFAEDKNYYMKGEQAYTEDHLLVYNVFVYKIPKKVTPEEAEAYFSNFGEVKKVRLVADKKRKARRTAPKVGFINFANPLAAAKVLKQSTHILQSKAVAVKACDSWYQPDGLCDDNVDMTAMDTDSEDIEVVTDKNSLLILNDDCLEHIFKKLSLKDQIRLSRVSQRMRNVFEMLCKSEHKTHDVEDLQPLTLWEIREFIKTAGPYIESLMGFMPQKDRERIVEFISCFCPNIKCINLDSSKLKSAVLKKLLDKLQCVRVLELRDCSLNDNAVVALQKLTNLESLILSDNYELTGKYMNQLKTVKELVLYGCGNIQSTYFINICKSLPQLKSLDIQRCDRLSAESFNEMVTHCQQLESLKISCINVHYECVARLPSLKKLEILCSSPSLVMRQQLFDALAEHKAEQLESLKVVSWNSISIARARQIGRISNLKHLICANNDNLTDECLSQFGELKQLEEIVLRQCRAITNDGLLNLLRKCNNLKKVNIQCCTLITDQFVLKAIELLKTTQALRGKEPCVFQVAKSGINNYIVNNAAYIAATAFIKLSFYVPITLGIRDDAPPYNIDDDDDDNIHDDDYDNEDYDDPYDMFDAFSDEDDYDDDVINNVYDMFVRPDVYDDIIW